MNGSPIFTCFSALSLVSTNPQKKYLNVQLLNAPLCSPASLLADFVCHLVLSRWCTMALSEPFCCVLQLRKFVTIVTLDPRRFVLVPGRNSLNQNNPLSICVLSVYTHYTQLLFVTSMLLFFCSRVCFLSILKNTMSELHVQEVSKDKEQMTEPRVLLQD